MSQLPLLDRHRASELLRQFSGVHVLVIGDAMLDHFISGPVRRISPEAPVPVVEFANDRFDVGGAANVAHNIAALGGVPMLVGLIGNDVAAGQLQTTLAACGVDGAGLIVDGTRRTTVKMRVVTERHHQVARIDYETDRDAAGETEQALIGAALERLPMARAVIVSDYSKGVVTAGICSEVLSQRAGTTPVLVDPKIPHLDRYGPVSLITPNNAEAEAATHRRIRTSDDVRSAAHALRRQTGCQAVLITRGEHGMWLSADDTEGTIPATARDVSDVTGAGDTVTAVLGLTLAVGASLTEAAMLANAAAGLVVAKFGPATVSRDELLATFKSERL